MGWQWTGRSFRDLDTGIQLRHIKGAGHMCSKLTITSGRGTGDDDDDGGGKFWWSVYKSTHKDYCFIVCLCMMANLKRFNVCLLIHTWWQRQKLEKQKAKQISRKLELETKDIRMVIHSAMIFGCKWK